jgi:hypothetical protein
MTKSNKVPRVPVKRLLSNYDDDASVKFWLVLAVKSGSGR